MKSFHKLIYFFSNKYYNNLKFNNRVLATTRLFFERTSKVSYSFQALGNVYRNSKWSDLHVFNIKESSLFQLKHVGFLLGLILTVLILSLKFDLEWANLLIFNLSEFILYLQDLLTSWSFFTLYTLSFCFLKLTYIFTKNVSSGLLPQMTTPTFPKKRFYKLTTSNSPASKLTSQEVLLSSLYLQKVLKYLHLVNLNDTHFMSVTDWDLTCTYFQSFPSYNIENIVYTLFFNNRYKYDLHNNISKKFVNKDTLYLKSIPNFKTNTNHTFELNLNILQFCNFLTQKEFQLIVKKNLNLSRENRWLTKHSLLSYDFITKLNSITHTKKLYGNNQLNSTVSDKNIWLSNRLTSTDTFYNLNLNKGFSDKSTLTTNILTKSTQLQLNNLEDSIFWLLIRFKFLQTTQAYLQYEQSDLSSSKRIGGSSKIDKIQNLHHITFLKNVSLANSVTNDLYTMHQQLWIIAQEHVDIRSAELIVDFNIIPVLNVLDLTFTKYLVNNLALQKNNILIYSNLS